MKKLTSAWQLLLLNTYWIGLSFKWNALHPIILPAILINLVPADQKNTYLGILTFIGLIVAMLVQPLAGAISDGWTSRWGRRRPFIIVATLFDLAFLAVIGWGNRLSTGPTLALLWIFIGYVGLQISSNFGQGPAQGLLPDVVAPEKVGTASGLKTLMDMTALIIASLAAGRLLDPAGKDPSLIILVLMVTVVLSVAVTVLGVREEPTPTFDSPISRDIGVRRARGFDWSELRSLFKVDFRANTAYWWLIAQRALFLLGIYGVQAFAQYYLRDVLNVANPVQSTGDLLAALTVGLVLLAIAGGWLSDRIGARKILSAACFISAIGFILLRLASTQVMLIVYGSVLGAGIGLFLTSSWALANKLAPAGEAGKFLGLTNLATAGSGALARLEGPAIDGLNAAYPGVWVGYTGLFIFGAVCVLVSAVLLNRVKIE
jgi:Na+/melibiose symporter-like transporter